jgi:hypothetical protein
MTDKGNDSTKTILTNIWMMDVVVPSQPLISNLQENVTQEAKNKENSTKGRQ